MLVDRLEDGDDDGVCVTANGEDDIGPAATPTLDDPILPTPDDPMLPTPDELILPTPDDVMLPIPDPVPGREPIPGMPAAGATKMLGCVGAMLDDVPGA